jgi:hypothetical protein
MTYPSDETVAEEFDEKFPCIESNCNNNGTITSGNEESGPEPEQCQYCFEYRLPVKQFISKVRATDRAAIVEIVEKLHDDYKGPDEGVRGYNEALTTLLTELKSL